MEFMSDRMDRPDFHTWSITANGELGGMISCERVSPWLGTAHIILKPGFQGKGLSMLALRQAFGEMFALGIGKLAFYPLAGSLAVGSLLVNLGAKREGKLVSHTLVGGKPADINLYGLLKEDFENANGAYTGIARRGNEHTRLDSRPETTDTNDHPNAPA